MTLLRTSLILLPLVGCGIFEEQTKNGTRIYLIPAGGPVAISVNGEEEKRLGNPVSVALGPGTHTIQVRDGVEHTVTLEAFDKVVVPVVSNQCFLSLNVTYSNYGGGAQKVPQMEGRRQRNEPFPMPDKHYISNNALPDSIDAGQTVYLLSSKSCQALDDLEWGLNGKVTVEGGQVDPVAGSVAKLRRSACKADNTSIWCTTLMGWNDATESPLPTEPAAFIGLAAAVSDKAEDMELTPETLSISTLVLNPKGAKLGILNPGGEQGKKTGLDIAAASLVETLNSPDGTPTIGSAFGGYLGRQAEAADGALTADGPGWKMGSAHLRKVGERWVSVERTDRGAVVAVNGGYSVMEE